MLNGTLKPNMESCDRPVTLGELEAGSTKDMVSKKPVHAGKKSTDLARNSSMNFFCMENVKNAYTS
jgi:hypothetical protein